MRRWTRSRRSSGSASRAFPIAARARAQGFSAASPKVGRGSRRSRPDVMHGHGAKGGAFVRLMPAPRAIRVYTPHGGSLHYGRNTLRGTVYGALERILMRRTELFLFESEFARNTYQAMVGPPHGDRARRAKRHQRRPSWRRSSPRRTPPISSIVGEFRHIKGTDVLIEAVAELHRAGRTVSAGHGRRRRGRRQAARAGDAARPRRQRPVPRPHAGAAGFRARPAAGGAVAGGIRCPMS